MCIIVRKEADTPIDDTAWEWLENCYGNNDDGAGMMYVVKSQGTNMVRVRKGFMTWEAFKQGVESRIDVIEKKEVIFHFRIGTSGSTDKAMCHPFPISKDDRVLGQTKTIVNAALVHNGVIPGLGTATQSDTHVFVRDMVSHLPWKTQAMRQLMASCLGSKFMIMSPETTYMMGNYVKEPGWMFSNDSYKRTPISYSSGVTYVTKYSSPTMYAGHTYGDDDSPFLDGFKYQYDGVVVPSNMEECSGCRNLVEMEELEDTKSWDMGFGESRDMFCYDCMDSVLDIHESQPLDLAKEVK